MNSSEGNTRFPKAVKQGVLSNGYYRDDGPFAPKQLQPVLVGDLLLDETIA